MSIFEPSIVKSIYDYALIEPTEAHVIFFNHTLPNERATIRELQEAMSELRQFKRWSWFPDELQFFEEGGNKGHSYVLWLGDFTGGALLFDDGTRLEEKYKWHKIDGQIHHWNEPHEGTKYSIILYRGNGKPPKSALIHTRMKRPVEPPKNES